MLQVTNGDSAAQSIGASGLGGAVLPWRDVLHEGPVPAGLDAAALRQTRAHFIADAGWASFDDTLADFTARDATLERYATAESERDEIVLWFEHDLYDQLQLLQVLDRLAGFPPRAARTTLICIGEHPEVKPFYGLGQLRPDQLAALFPSRQPLAPAQLALARAAWAAFRSPDPTAIVHLLSTESAPLPYLGGALERHLEEFPAVEDGLSRTERQIIEAVAAGENAPGPLFLAHFDREERPFLGDRTFFDRVSALAHGAHPALARDDGQPFLPLPPDGPSALFVEQRLVLTDVGRGLLASRADWVHLNGLDRWYGGVHLTGHTAAWRWSRASQRLVPDAQPNQG